MRIMIVNEPVLLRRATLSPYMVYMFSLCSKIYIDA